MKWSKLVFTALLLICASLNAQNFMIYGTEDLRVGQKAEEYRKSLALEWFGEEIPTWQRPARIRVNIGPKQSGVTVTHFIDSVSYHDCTVNGPNLQEILDNVLPHEIWHMVSAAKFGRQVPRWWGEGTASLCEKDADEHRKRLINYLSTGRGVPFNRMFSAETYPGDIHPFYTQATSLSDFLIRHDSKHLMTHFLVDAMSSTWKQSLKKYYNYDSLSDLQVSWNEWVQKGFPNPPTEEGQLGLLFPNRWRFQGGQWVRVPRDRILLPARAGQCEGCNGGGSFGGGGRISSPSISRPPSRPSVGPQGPQGPPGQTPTIDYDRIIDGIAGKLPKSDPVDLQPLLDKLDDLKPQPIDLQPLLDKLDNIKPTDIQPVLDKLDDLTKPEPLKPSDWTIYYTEKGTQDKELQQVDAMAEELHRQGYRIVITRLDPRDTKVNGVPRLFTVPERKTIRGMSNVRTHLALVTSPH